MNVLPRPTTERDWVACSARFPGFLRVCCGHAGGTTVSGAVLCPENERRMIVSLDTSKVWKRCLMSVCVVCFVGVVLSGGGVFFCRSSFFWASRVVLFIPLLSPGDKPAVCFASQAVAAQVVGAVGAIASSYQGPKSACFVWNVQLPKMNRIIWIDKSNMLARIEAGVTGQALEAKVGAFFFLGCKASCSLALLCVGFEKLLVVSFACPITQPSPLHLLRTSSNPFHVFCFYRVAC